MKTKINIKFQKIRDDFLNFIHRPGVLAKISWAVLGLAFGLVTVLLTLDLVVSKGRGEALSKRESDNVLALAQGAISPVFEKANIILQRVVHDYAPAMRQLDVLDPSIINEDLGRLMVGITEAQQDSLRLVNADGKVVYTAGYKEGSPDLSVADKSYFVTQKSNKIDGLLISEPILSRSTGNWLLVLSRSVKNEDGSFAGIAQVAIRSEFIQELFDKVTVGSNSGISLIAMDGGTLVRSPQRAENVDREFKMSAVFNLIAKNVTHGNVAVPSLIDGTTHQLSFLKMEGSPLIVAVGISPDDYLNEWYKKATYYTICLLFVAFMMVALSHISAQTKQSERDRDEALAQKASAESDVATAQQFMKESHRHLTDRLKAAKTFLNELEQMNPSLELGGSVLRIKNTLDEGSRVIRAINLLSDLEAKKFAVTIRRFDVTKMLKDVLTEAIPSARVHVVDLDMGHSGSIEIEADQEHLEDALAFVVQNAIRWGKYLGLSVRTTTGVHEDKTAFLKVEVAEIGKQSSSIGSEIAAACRQDLFNCSTSDMEFIAAWKILKLLNGVIVESSTGQQNGAFVISIPVQSVG